MAWDLLSEVERLPTSGLGVGSHSENWGRFWNSNHIKRWGEGICRLQADLQSPWACQVKLEGYWKGADLLVGLGFQLGRFGAILEFKQHKAMGRGNLHTAGS